MSEKTIRGLDACAGGNSFDSWIDGDLPQQEQWQIFYRFFQESLAHFRERVVSISYLVGYKMGEEGKKGKEDRSLCSFESMNLRVYENMDLYVPFRA